MFINLIDRYFDMSIDEVYLKTFKNNSFELPAIEVNEFHHFKQYFKLINAMDVNSLLKNLSSTLEKGEKDKDFKGIDWGNISDVSEVVKMFKKYFLIYTILRIGLTDLVQKNDTNKSKKNKSETSDTKKIFQNFVFFVYRNYIEADDIYDASTNSSVIAMFDLIIQVQSVLNAKFKGNVDHKKFAPEATVFLEVYDSTSIRFFTLQDSSTALHNIMKAVILRNDIFLHSDKWILSELVQSGVESNDEIEYIEVIRGSNIRFDVDHMIKQLPKGYFTQGDVKDFEEMLNTFDKNLQFNDIERLVLGLNFVYTVTDEFTRITNKNNKSERNNFYNKQQSSSSSVQNTNSSSSGHITRINSKVKNILGNIYQAKQMDTVEDKNVNKAIDWMSRTITYDYNEELQLLENLLATDHSKNPDMYELKHYHTNRYVNLEGGNENTHTFTKHQTGIRYISLISQEYNDMEYRHILADEQVFIRGIILTNMTKPKSNQIKRASMTEINENYIIKELFGRENFCVYVQDCTVSKYKELILLLYRIIRRVFKKHFLKTRTIVSKTCQPIVADLHDDVRLRIGNSLDISNENRKRLNSEALEDIEFDNLSSLPSVKFKRLKFESLRDTVEDNTVVKEKVHKIVCQHEIDYDEIKKQSSISKKEKLMFNLVEHYGKRVGDNTIACRSCGGKLQVSETEIQGEFEGGNQVYLIYRIENKQNVSERKEFRDLQNTLSFIKNTVDWYGRQFKLPFGGTDKDAAALQNNIMNDLLDLLVANNNYIRDYVTNVDKSRAQSRQRNIYTKADRQTYGIDVNDSQLFGFILDEKLFNDDKTDKYRGIKNNNTMAYIILTLIMNVSESNLTNFVIRHKLCHFEKFKEAFPFIGSHYIHINSNQFGKDSGKEHGTDVDIDADTNANGANTDDGHQHLDKLSNYPILAYLIFMFTSILVFNSPNTRDNWITYERHLTDQQLDKVSKSSKKTIQERMIETLSKSEIQQIKMYSFKSAIRTVIDILNSVIYINNSDLNHKKPTIYSTFANKYLRKLNTVFNSTASFVSIEKAFRTMYYPDDSKKVSIKIKSVDTVEVRTVAFKDTPVLMKPSLVLKNLFRLKTHPNSQIDFKHELLKERLSHNPIILGTTKHCTKGLKDTYVKLNANRKERKKKVVTNQNNVFSLAERRTQLNKTDDIRADIRAVSITNFVEQLFKYCHREDLKDKFVGNRIIVSFDNIGKSLESASKSFLISDVNSIQNESHFKAPVRFVNTSNKSTRMYFHQNNLLYLGYKDNNNLYHDMNYTNTVPLFATVHNDLITSIKLFGFSSKKYRFFKMLTYDTKNIFPNLDEYERGEAISDIIFKQDAKTDKVLLNLCNQFLKKYIQNELSLRTSNIRQLGVVIQTMVMRINRNIKRLKKANKKATGDNDARLDLEKEYNANTELDSIINYAIDNIQDTDTLYWPDGFLSKLNDIRDTRKNLDNILQDVLKEMKKNVADFPVQKDSSLSRKVFEYYLTDVQLYSISESQNTTDYVLLQYIVQEITKLLGAQKLNTSLKYLLIQTIINIVKVSDKQQNYTCSFKNLLFEQIMDAEEYSVKRIGSQTQEDLEIAYTDETDMEKRPDGRPSDGLLSDGLDDGINEADANDAMDGEGNLEDQLNDIDQESNQLGEDDDL